jgi:hypothetical protein
MAAGRASLESRQKLPRPLVVPSFRSASRGPSAARVAQMWLRQPSYYLEPGTDRRNLVWLVHNNRSSTQRLLPQTDALVSWSHRIFDSWPQSLCPNSGLRASETSLFSTRHDFHSKIRWLDEPVVYGTPLSIRLLELEIEPPHELRDQLGHLQERNVPADACS